MRRLLRRFLLEYLGIGAGVLAATLFILFYSKNTELQTEPLMTSIYSRIEYAFNPPPVAPELFGIVIDTQTIKRIGELPLGEEYLANVLSYLNRNGVKTVGINMQFSEISPTESDPFLKLKNRLNMKVVGEFRFNSQEVECQGTWVPYS